jgi:hypothetical protein
MPTSRTSSAPVLQAVCAPGRSTFGGPPPLSPLKFSSASGRSDRTRSRGLALRFALCGQGSPADRGAWPAAGALATSGATFAPCRCARDRAIQGRRDGLRTAPDRNPDPLWTTLRTVHRGHQPATMISAARRPRRSMPRGRAERSGHSSGRPDSRATPAESSMSAAARGRRWRRHSQVRPPTCRARSRSSSTEGQAAHPDLRIDEMSRWPGDPAEGRTGGSMPARRARGRRARPAVESWAGPARVRRARRPALRSSVRRACRPGRPPFIVRSSRQGCRPPGTNRPPARRRSA